MIDKESLQQVIIELRVSKNIDQQNNQEKQGKTIETKTTMPSH
jgi:hypothetical protein